MVFYFRMDVISPDGGKLNYGGLTKKEVSTRISILKFEWEPQNKGKPGVKHATVCCQSEEATIPGATRITKAEYDDVDKIELISDRIDLPGQAVAKISAKFPKEKGKATFKVIYPDNTTERIEVNVGPNGNVKMPDFKSSKTGKIKIILHSDVFNAPQIPRKVIEIDSS